MVTFASWHINHYFKTSLVSQWLYKILLVMSKLLKELWNVTEKKVKFYFIHISYVWCSISTENPALFLSCFGPFWSTSGLCCEIWFSFTKLEWAVVAVTNSLILCFLVPVFCAWQRASQLIKRPLCLWREVVPYLVQNSFKKKKKKDTNY